MKNRFPSKAPTANGLYDDRVPVPPKRNYKNRLNAALHSSNSTGHDEVESVMTSPTQSVAAGAGLNVPRILGSQSAGNNERNLKANPPKVYENIYNPPSSEIRDYLLSQSPDVMIGDGVEIKGNFQFDGLLRLDGRFQGDFITEEGDLIVGPTGVLISDLKNVQHLLIDGGHVHGKIEVAFVSISGSAMIKGSIRCKQLEIVDSEATILAETIVDATALDHLNVNEAGVVENEPIKIISYNKSKSTKSIHEKVSPQDIQQMIEDPSKEHEADLIDQEEKKNNAEALLRAKNEEKKKRREEKQRNEAEERILVEDEKKGSKEVQENQSTKGPAIETKEEKKPENPTVMEGKVEEMRQKHSAKVIQNAWTSKKSDSKTNIQSETVDPGDQMTTEDPATESSVEIGPIVSSEASAEKEEKANELRQKHSAKVIQNAWMSKKSDTKGNPNNEEVEENRGEALEDSLEAPKNNESTESLGPPQEVHLVSGALGSIPSVVIQPKTEKPVKDTESNPEPIENTEKNAVDTEPEKENEMQKYGLSAPEQQLVDEENKNVGEAAEETPEHS